MRKVVSAFVAVLVIFAVVFTLPVPAKAEVYTPAQSVIFVGDSITAKYVPGLSWGDIVTDRTYGVTADESRVATYAVSALCLTAQNCGAFDGDSSPLITRWESHVLSLFPGSPSTIFVEIGTNDLAKATVQQMKDAYQYLHTSATAIGKRVVFFTITPRGSERWTDYWWWGPSRDAINDWLVATYGPNVVDLDPVLGQPDGWAIPGYMADSIHPNTLGQVKMAYAVPRTLLCAGAH